MNQKPAEIRREIAQIIRDRSVALHKDDYRLALTLTEQLIQCFERLGTKTPPFQPFIVKDGKTLWFAGFKRKQAIYSAHVSNPVIPFGRNGVEQMGLTMRQRLADENVARLSAGQGFGYSDDLQGDVLNAVTFDDLLWQRIQGVA